MKIESRSEVCWLNQPGRLSSKMGSVADGFRGSGSIAGAAALAEGAPAGKGAVMQAVSAVRDSFAEGVAYGVPDVFRDVIEDLGTMDDGPAASMAAAVILDGSVCVFSSGSCRAFTAMSGDRGVPAVPKLLPQGRVVSLQLEPGQSVVLVTEGLAGLARSSEAVRIIADCGSPLERCLEEMVSETRIRFRQKGGSAAALRYCRNRRSLPRVSSRNIVYPLIAACVVLVALMLLCEDGSSQHMEELQDRSGNEEMVLPLD